VLDDKTLGFADFAGNRLYITLGNLTENPKAFIFLIDYRNRQRIKIWGLARVVDDPELLKRLKPGRLPSATGASDPLHRFGVGFKLPAAYTPALGGGGSQSDAGRARQAHSGVSGGAGWAA
jgi:hypothetical protein